MKEFAYPFPGETNANGEVIHFAEPGLTKLEYFAAAALQGILANPDFPGIGPDMDLMLGDLEAHKTAGILAYIYASHAIRQIELRSKLDS